jgi:hypothetical protein
VSAPNQRACKLSDRKTVVQKNLVFILADRQDRRRQVVADDVFSALGFILNSAA